MVANGAETGIGALLPQFASTLLDSLASWQTARRLQNLGAHALSAVANSPAAKQAFAAGERWLPALPTWTQEWPGETFALKNCPPFLRVKAGEHEFLCAVPMVPGETTTVAVSFAADERDYQRWPVLTCRFSEPGMDRFWQFASARTMEEARVMARGVMGYGADASELAAAVACYVMLRLGAGEEVLQFARAVRGVRPQSPDMLVVEAEMLARTGDHERAGKVLGLLGSGAQPWPLLRPGIDYARQRVAQQTRWSSASPVLAMLPRLMSPDSLSLVLRTPSARAAARVIYPAAFA